MNQYVKDYHQYTNEINFIPSQLVLFSFSPGFSGDKPVFYMQRIIFFLLIH